MSEYFPELKYSVRRVKVEINMTTYATKAHLKNATGVDTSNFAETVGLTSIKPNIDIEIRY